MAAEWPDSCPGGCGAPVQYGLSRYGKALRTCQCRDTIGRRNKRKGRKAQARGYRRLGGSAPFTPGNEENQGVLSVEVGVESKAGKQVPASFTRFVALEWTRRALSQAERSIPVGVEASPAVYLEPAGGGRWLVVKL